MESAESSFINAAAKGQKLPGFTYRMGLKIPFNFTLYQNIFSIRAQNICFLKGVIINQTPTLTF
jgi:hypothetical protein